MNVPIVSNDTCNSAEAYSGKISTTEICAGIKEGGKDSCQGDSGGPLVINDNVEFVQAGVVSWGEGCAVANKYGVYARVNAFNAWVNDVKSGNGTGVGDDSGGGDNEIPVDGYLFSGELVEGIEGEGEGDADIYVKHQQQNTMSDYDFAPLNWVNDEQVLIKRPQQGTWYIKIIGYEAYHDLELMGFAR